MSIVGIVGRVNVYSGYCRSINVYSGYCRPGKRSGIYLRISNGCLYVQSGKCLVTANLICEFLANVSY